MKSFSRGTNFVLRLNLTDGRQYNRIVDSKTVKYYIPGSLEPPKTGNSEVIRGEGYIETKIPLADLKDAKEIVFFPDRYLVPDEFTRYDTL